MHEHTTDRLFVTSGTLKVVLFDGRRGSPSCNRINDFCFGIHRPTLLVIPSGVWHAVKNVGSVQVSLVNLVDSAYSYEQPDHWRLPSDSDQIPYVL